MNLCSPFNSFVVDLLIRCDLTPIMYSVAHARSRNELMELKGEHKFISTNQVIFKKKYILSHILIF